MSTNHAACSFTTSILQAWNDEFQFGRVFCDRAKGLNCVNHDKLTSKLEYCVRFVDFTPVLWCPWR
jgi:hypothetical protein